MSLNLLYQAVKNENIDDVKRLLKDDQLDIKYLYILNIYFYKIQNHTVQ